MVILVRNAEHIDSSDRSQNGERQGIYSVFRKRNPHDLIGGRKEGRKREGPYSAFRLMVSIDGR